MATRGSYVHNYNGRIFGGIPKILVLCNFLRELMVSDKKIHRAFRTHTILYILKPISDFFFFFFFFFIFTILPRLYNGFNIGNYFVR